jgi:HlyD family secretion protein
VQQLQAESIASRSELDDAENALRLAEADVVTADAQIVGLTAQLESANTTLGYTKIHSPIDGVVVTRAVDPGQTVAASFSAPVLFVIAQSLTDMQVLADIDEADVGKVREGMLARVSVDAFPGESFEGKVTQIRYSPTEIQGVVTYAAVLAVENAELKLRPGMTATVSVTTAQVEGRPAVKNAALRFKPSDPGSVGAPLDLDVNQRRVYVPAGEAAEKPAAEKPAASAGAGDASGPVAAAPELTPLVVRVGISDGVWTALESDELAVGAPVVVQERSAPGEERRKLLGIF